MALELSFSIVEQNDNKLVTISDTAGVYDAITNLTGWGTPNPIVSAIDGTTHTLSLDITLTTSDKLSTIFDTIDLFTTFAPVGGFVDVSDLVFGLDRSMLKEAGVSYGTSDDEFPDGLYTITYTYDKGLATEVEIITTVLLDGRVANAVYELLRTLPTQYECGGCHDKEILDIIFMNTYLMSVHSSAYSARTTSILDQLNVLEKLVTNVSSYTW